jgi:glycosyltransferase involved in cell wall biosynthesis
MKKILIITDNLPDQVNGVVTTFTNIEKNLVLDGYSVLYLNPRQFKYFDCPGYSEVKLSLPWKIGQKIKEMDADHIHIATEGPIGLFARFYLNKHRIVYNTSYHTKFPEFLKKIYGIPEGITYKYLRWFHKDSKQVLVPTEELKNELEEKKFKNLKVWTRGVDTKIFNSKRRSLVPNGQNYIVCVSRVSKEKGLDDFCQLKGNKVLIGDGPYLNTLKEKYPNVIFLGVKKGVELAEWIANADVFVFPSKTDTFGIVILESIACGTPVASYIQPGPLEVIEPMYNGMYSDNLQHSVTACYQINRNEVYKSSKKWTWENSTKQFKEALA